MQLICCADVTSVLLLHPCSSSGISWEVGVCVIHHFLAVGSVICTCSLQKIVLSESGTLVTLVALTECVMLGCVQQRHRGETPCLSSPWSSSGDSSVLTLPLSDASSASAQISMWVWSPSCNATCYASPFLLLNQSGIQE